MENMTATIHITVEETTETSEVSASGYDDWRRRETSAHAKSGGGVPGCRPTGHTVPIVLDSAVTPGPSPVFPQGHAPYAGSENWAMRSR